MEHKATGKIIHKEGKYFLEVAGKVEALPVSFQTDTKILEENVGKEVEVFRSIPTSFVVALKLPKRPIITCNVPLPDFLNNESLVTQPTAAVTRNVATYLYKGGFITKEVHDTIINSYESPLQAAS